MTNNELTITMDSKGDDIDAIAALEVLTETGALLREIEQARLGGRANHRWTFSGASKSNPLVMTIGSVVSHDRGTALDPVADLLESLGLLETGARPELFTESMLTRARKIAKRVGAGLAGLAFRDTRNHTMKWSAQLAGIAEKMQLPSSYSEHGELEGVLGQLTAYGTAHEFCIFDGLSGRKIHCDFSPADFEKVRHAIRKRVRVSGLIKYSRDDDAPERMTVEHWDPLPDDSDLPEIEELHALELDFARGRPSEEVIADLRRGDD